MSIEGDFFRSILDSFSDGVYFVDRQRVITYWNQGAERITGYSAATVIGTRCSDDLLVHVDSAGRNLCQGLCPVAATIGDGCHREARVFLRHRDGHRVPVKIRVAPLFEADGTVMGAVEVFHDDAETMAALERVDELQRAIYLDALTGLANRTYTEITVRARLDEMVRYRWPFGVLFLDVDHFKLVNDGHGHETGDRVLRAVAGTLAKSARSFDLVGRWGGDEFVAVVANVDLPAVATLAERFRALVETSRVSCDGRALPITVSVGAALARAGDTTDGLLRRADALMYESKRAGRNTATVETP
jgi:diguanylate cyclase (GGDEF)-like protein/PAS domain S-box-containing protein